MVPENLSNISLDFSKSTDLEIQVESYNTFGEINIDGLMEGKFILLLDNTNFKNHIGKNKELSGKLLGIGKIIILIDEEDLKNSAIPMIRGIDVMDIQPGKDLFNFKIHKTISEIEFEDEINTLKTYESRLDTLNEIGVALSTEEDLHNLLELIVAKSRELTWADAGSLYLIETDQSKKENPTDFLANKKMRFHISQCDSADFSFQSLVLEISKASIYGYVAIKQEALNIEDVYYIPEEKEYGWGGKEFDASNGYRSMSIMAVPMVNHQGETIGVIQLINRKIDPSIILSDPKEAEKYIQPFTQHDVRLAMSIASQASIAIQNTQLVDSIRTLFDGFINASVRAIESRDPTTAGHSQRVATLTVGLAELVDQSDSPKFRDVKFSSEQIQELRYASLLHDFGKIGVREEVLVKAKKLYPHEMQSVEDRFELIRTLTALKNTIHKVRLLENLNEEDTKALLAQAQIDFDQEINDVNELMKFIQGCNEPTVLAQGGFDQLHDIANRNFNKLNGESVKFLKQDELISLSVKRGSLTELDRKAIEYHVTDTYKFLKTIPWTSNLKNVAEIAYAHHEKLDGTGYPNRLNADTIPIQSKMMTVADIFDALTASDRPYKKALPAERALNILQEEVKAAHIDGDLLEIFIVSEKYKEVLVPG